MATAIVHSQLASLRWQVLAQRCSRSSSLSTLALALTWCRIHVRLAWRENCSNRSFKFKALIAAATASMRSIQYGAVTCRCCARASSFRRWELFALRDEFFATCSEFACFAVDFALFLPRIVPQLTLSAARASGAIVDNALAVTSLQFVCNV